MIHFENIGTLDVAKKIIEDKGIDIKNISGSGIGGKIIKEDVLNLNQESRNQILFFSFTMTLDMEN